MNTFLTLLWLEFRKFSGFGLALLVVGVLWFFVARQFFEWNGSNLESAAAVLGITFLSAFVASMAFLVALAQDFTREYRAGRWALLLGAPQPGWLHLAVKALFGLVVLTLFNGGMWLVQAFWLGQAGVNLPFSLGASVWLYLLGGLALVIPALFTGLWIAAYIPGKATTLAFFIGAIGLGQVLEWNARLFGNWFYQLLPPWRLPAPTLEQNPMVRLQLERFPGLPTEGFVLLAVLTALFFLAASRLWQEVEA
jgi:hypothetical protein|uniref:Uncharacterized protein n=1 Tax=Meiothermus ruber TaxID=277 RepID=A0A7C3H9Z4_MEIRU